MIDTHIEPDLTLFKSQKKRVEQCKPTLTEISLIPELYVWFCGIHEIKTCKKKSQEVYRRRLFVYLVVKLYSPAKLYKNRYMVEGVREELLKLLPLKAASSVSNDVIRTLCWFKFNKAFYEDVNSLYTEVNLHIAQKGWIETNTIENEKQK